MKALCLTGIVGTLNNNFFALNLDGHHGVEFTSKFALAALYGNNMAVNLNLNARRNSNRILPIRDICAPSFLPDVRHDFAADAFLCVRRGRS